MNVIVRVLLMYTAMYKTRFSKILGFPRKYLGYLYDMLVISICFTTCMGWHTCMRGKKTLVVPIIPFFLHTLLYIHIQYISIYPLTPIQVVVSCISPPIQSSSIWFGFGIHSYCFSYVTLFLLWDSSLKDSSSKDSSVMREITTLSSIFDSFHRYEKQSEWVPNLIKEEQSVYIDPTF